MLFLKPDIKKLSLPSARIRNLRKYYSENSPMVINRDLVPWKCSHSLCLYIEGWLKNGNSPTMRLRRAEAERYMLEHTKPVIIPGELIVGQPDFSGFEGEEAERFAKYNELWSAVPPARGRLDHMALDYPKLLNLGVEGLIDELKTHRDSLDLIDGRNAGKYEFFQSCVTELEGLLTLQKNYADEARRLASESDGSEREDFLKLAETLDHVPAKPARTFREALQSVHFFLYSLYGIYSAGRPDQYLLPYYRRDIEAGILDESSAQELIDSFCLQYMNNMSAWAAAGFMIGGRDPDGNQVENELTWHFLTAIRHIHTPDPNVGFCVTSETSDEILTYAAEIIRDGHGNPQIWNSDKVTASMIGYGYDRRDANNFTHSTCVEITPIGCSGVSITSPYINMLKVFTDTFMKCPDDISFDELFENYRRDFTAYCDKAIFNENLWQLERARNGTDPARISALIGDCVGRGISSDAGGARYNFIEPNMLGMTNVIESLNVIRELVYNEKKLTIAEFRKALSDNYKGHEELRDTIINRVGHFGNNTKETNELAKRVSDMVLGIFSRYTTFRGAKVIPGAFSYRDHASNGKNTMASPDGRLSGTPLAAGSDPVQGYDRLGPTMSLCSSAAWEPSRFLGGTALNVKLNRNTPVSAIKALIRGFLKTGDVQTQFNIVNTEELLDAQLHPENHGDLIVRIGGYSDYFTRIPKVLQDDVISRSMGD